MIRYGIGEWYGRKFLSLVASERHTLAETALGARAAPACPFRPMTCNKSGGVCSIQGYSDRGDRIRAADGGPVVVCPERFEQDDVLVQWLADIVGFKDQPMVAREVPFMSSTHTEKPAGKIDMVVASDGSAERWFGLEIQAVYFSGPGMKEEFEALRSDNRKKPPFPRRNRRPDWRSSGAKRLMPQLQVKGPTLRRWHSKVAVAVDVPFFESLGGPSDNPSHDLDDGDVVWLIPELHDGKLQRGHWEVLTLEASSEKLLAARTVSRRDFEQALRRKLQPISNDEH